MKNFKISIIALAATMLLSLQSCRDEYLNEPKPTEKVGPDVVYGSKEVAEAYMAGILRATRMQFIDVDSGNMSSIYFARTVKGNDFIINNGWFNFDYSNSNRDSSYRRPRFTWQFLYKTINRLNVFIEGVNGSTKIPQSDKDRLLAQAYTMRAYMYFELSLEFQNTYTYDPSLPSLPIYKEGDGNSLKGKPMSTQKEVYDFILSDINKALAIGSEQRIDKSYYGKQVTYGLAARVYQVLRNWNEASKFAKLAYGSNVEAALSPEVYGDGFADMNAGKEWILTTPQRDDQSAYYWTAPFAFTDHTTVSHKNTYVNKTLVGKFTDTDVRKQFTDTGLTDHRQYYTTKFKFIFSSDIPLMRTAEMILIDAEALYHNGQTADAHDLLYELQKNRDPQATKSANIGTALLEEILLERRKELYGEFGVEWYDAKRLRRGITRDPWHKVNMSTNQIQPDDKRFILHIPAQEIETNPHISASINDNR